MGYSNQGRFRQQVRFLRRQFLQDGDLPFTDVLSEEVVSQALTAISACWMDRIYSPLVTLWIFLGQVLSADHSCRAAVARLIAHRVSQGQSPCSAETGAYCQAKTRKGSTQRFLLRSLDQDLFEEVEARMRDPTFKQKRSERMWKSEGLFAEAKQNHNLARVKYRGRPKCRFRLTSAPSRRT